MRFAVWTLAALVALQLHNNGHNSSFLARADDSLDDDIDEPSPIIEDEEPAEVYIPPEGAEEFRYEAEVSRMLDIVVNSLYQNKDVFLRELISNASDALDKVRYLLLTNPEQYGTTGGAEEIPLEVKISYDEDAKTLTIQDTGVGMTKEDMVKNLGTVARSGTTKFLEAMKESGGDAVNQIGQFGVGFYSAFLVANRVTVASKNPLDPVQHIWESTNGASEFHVYEDPRGNSMQRGTEITLHLKSDAADYVKPYKLKELAGHYSEFVTYPISLRTTEVTQVEVDDEETDEDKKSEDDEDLEVSEEEDAEEEKPKKTKEVTTYSWEVINGNPAIWTRDKDEITDDEYQAFWDVLANDGTNATAWSHFNAEGNINFKSILYLPSEIPMSYKYGNMDMIDGAMRLYVRKVLIGDKFELLPKYLGFIRGVVDSDDMPLNVNRETLQESKILRVIQKKLVRKAIDMIRQLSKEEDEDNEEGDDDDTKPKTPKYIDWYKKFSTNLKLGVLEDYGNQAKLLKLLRYETSKSDGKMVSFSDYVENMKDWQKDIYVLGCGSIAECKQSSFLEPFAEKDVEVMFMTDAIDEYMMRSVRDFDKKKLVQISSENVKFGDEDEDLIKRREKVYKKQFEPLTKALKKLYKNTVTRVQVAKRPLGTVPAIVSSADFGNSANMERIMRAQAFQQGQDPMQVQAMKIFELNPRHPLVVKLLAGVPTADAEGDDAALSEETIDAAWMLHDLAMLNGGFPISDPDAHNKRLVKIMKTQLGLESLSLEPEINPPVEEEEEKGDSEDGEIDMDAFDINNIDIEALKAQMGGDEL